MPRDDFDKYNRRDKGKKALREATTHKGRPLPAGTKEKKPKYLPPKKKCRCCLKKKRNVGRADICLDCYKFHKHNVHEIANKRSPIGHQPHTTTGLLPKFADRPMISYLEPPYAKIHPVPEDA